MAVELSKKILKQMCIDYLQAVWNFLLGDTLLDICGMLQFFFHHASKPFCVFFSRGFYAIFCVCLFTKINISITSNTAASAFGQPKILIMVSAVV